MSDLLLIIKSLFTGIVVGLIFAGFKLPIPAPPAIAGIMGIIGIYLGFLIWTKFFGS